MKTTSIRPRGVALALLGCLGCGATKAASVDPADGGDGGSTVSGARSFDVTATLSPAGAAPPSGLPSTVDFTLVLDTTSGLAIVGGKGLASAAHATSADGRTFQLPQFSVGLDVTQCSGASTIEFKSLTATVSGSTLSGTATGAGHVSCGDCQFDVPFAADVTGVADVTPPVLSAASVPASAFAAFSLTASEPLPATATARLVGSDGSHIDLIPTIFQQDDVTIINAFTKPAVVLPFGVGFGVALDGLVDFAGLRGAADVPLRLTSFPEPPLVPEDGFESATGAQVGGATVIGDGPLPPITGARSLYLGPAGVPAPSGVSVGAALHVRLAVQPGDTALRFSYRVVSPFLGLGFGGALDLGSVGHSIASDTLAVTSQGTPVTWPDGRTVYMTDVATKAIALPADVTGELVFAIETASVVCGGLLTLPMPSGLLIDDLRVE